VGEVMRKPQLDEVEFNRIGFSYFYDVTSVDWGTIDKELEISIDWTDTAGNCHCLPFLPSSWGDYTGHNVPLQACEKGGKQCHKMEK
jgi:hypothetical protein